MGHANYYVGGKSIYYAGISIVPTGEGFSHVFIAWQIVKNENKKDYRFTRTRKPVKAVYISWLSLLKEATEGREMTELEIKNVFPYLKGGNDEIEN